MRDYLGTSISSMNLNKLHGLLAEVDLRRHLSALGYADRVSPGGWIARREGPGTFAHNTIVFFPEVILPGTSYAANRQKPQPSHGLHTICSTFHQTGISAYYCAASVGADDDCSSVTWESVQLGLPTEQPYKPFPDSIIDFSLRSRRYNFLQYETDTEQIPDQSVAEEFSKENIRVIFQSRFMSQISDLDGIFWGQQYTYPLEIKEKTAGSDNRMGEFFGLDLGPFVKLAYYAAKRGNLHSLFVVKEIESIERRELVDWWFIPFDRLARFASWVPQQGGANMLGGRSTVVQIPKSEFSPLNAANLADL